jgi:hypothetical protein
MSTTTTVTIHPPGSGLPAKWADAFGELQAIAEKLKPNANKVPDVDEIEPLVRRARELADHCEARIAAVKAVLDQDGRQTEG